MKADLIAELERVIQPDKIDEFSKYFGIAPGKYGEGDIYLAINTTKMRKICKKYKKIDKPMTESYIIDNYTRMSRLTIRAAIDSMPEEQRLQFLHGEFDF